MDQIAPAAGPVSKVRSAGKKFLATKSNKNIVKNALMHVSLAGTLNKEVKQEVLQVTMISANARIFKSLTPGISLYYSVMSIISVFEAYISGIILWIKLSNCILVATDPQKSILELFLNFTSMIAAVEPLSQYPQKVLVVLLMPSRSVESILSQN
jgi:hypothetical protein